MLWFFFYVYYESEKTKWRICPPRVELIVEQRIFRSENALIHSSYVCHFGLVFLLFIHRQCAFLDLSINCHSDSKRREKVAKWNEVGKEGTLAYDKIDLKYADISLKQGMPYHLLQGIWYRTSLILVCHFVLYWQSRTRPNCVSTL